MRARASTVRCMRRSLGSFAILAVCVLAAGTSSAATAARADRCRGRAPARSSRPRTSGTARSQNLPVAANSDAMIRAIGIDAPVHPGLRLVPRLRHSRTTSSRASSVAQGERLVRLRRRVRSRRLSDAGASEPGGERRRAHPGRRQGHLPPLRAVRRGGPAATAGRPARAPSGTCAPTICARTAGRRPTPRACRSCRDSCATTRSQPGAIRHALRFTGRAHRELAHLPGAPRRRRLRRRRCRRWACACGSRPRSTSRSYGKQARVVAAGAQDLRDDPRRQRLATGSSRAPATSSYNDDDLHDLGKIKGSDFEVVDTSGLRNG